MKAVAILICVCALIFSGALAAAGPGDLGTTRTAIAAQPLARALTALRQQTNLMMLYVSALARGKTSASVPPGLPALEALKQMLAGTDLSYKMLNEHTVEIRAGNKANEWDRGAGENPLHFTPADRTAGYVSGTSRFAQGDRESVPVVQTLRFATLRFVG